MTIGENRTMMRAIERDFRFTLRHGSWKLLEKTHNLVPFPDDGCSDDASDSKSPSIVNGNPGGVAQQDSRSVLLRNRTHYYDTLLVNIVAGPLKILALHLGRYCRPGGCLLLAGFQSFQFQDLKAVYADAGFDINIVGESGQWKLAFGRKR